MIHVGQDPAKTAMGSSQFGPDAHVSGALVRLHDGRRALRDRIRTMFVAVQVEQWNAFRTREAELASYGVRWDEANLDCLLALELREHRAARHPRTLNNA